MNLKKNEEKNSRKQEISFLLLYTLPRNIFGYVLMFAFINYLAGVHEKLFLALTMAGAIFTLDSLLHTLAKHWPEMKNVGILMLKLCSAALTLGFIVWVVVALLNLTIAPILGDWRIGQNLPMEVEFIFSLPGFIAALVLFISAIRWGMKESPIAEDLKYNEVF